MVVAVVYWKRVVCRSLTRWNQFSRLDGGSDSRLIRSSSARCKVPLSIPTGITSTASIPAAAPTNAWPSLLLGLVHRVGVQSRCRQSKTLQARKPPPAPNPSKAECRMSVVEGIRVAVLLHTCWRWM